jgi:hypothetical protein
MEMKDFLLEIEMMPRIFTPEAGHPENPDFC